MVSRLRCCLAALCLFGPGAAVASPDAGAATDTWQAISRGVEMRDFDWLHVVRINPTIAHLRFVLAAEEKSQARTAAEWVKRSRLSVAINAGMYERDYSTTTGFCRDGPNTINAKWNDYQTAFAFGPKEPKLPPAVMVDLDSPGSREQLSRYTAVIQNLRLIKGNGVSVWKPNARQWSEAAIAMDSKGRVLFLFSRTPWTMSEFNRKLLELPLDVVRAMHVEGGPEASLSIRTRTFSVDWMGSYETGFEESDDNRRQWPIPNVIGVTAD